nr:MAG TPA: hypothetical protein [Caudoviricetes sp.]
MKIAETIDISKFMRYCNFKWRIFYGFNTTFLYIF